MFKYNRNQIQKIATWRNKQYDSGKWLEPLSSNSNYRLPKLSPRMTVLFLLITSGFFLQMIDASPIKSKNKKTGGSGNSIKKSPFEQNNQSQQWVEKMIICGAQMLDDGKIEFEYCNDTPLFFKESDNQTPQKNKKHLKKKISDSVSSEEVRDEKTDSAMWDQYAENALIDIDHFLKNFKTNKLAEAVSALNFNVNEVVVSISKNQYFDLSNKKISPPVSLEDADGIIYQASLKQIAQGEGGYLGKYIFKTKMEYFRFQMNMLKDILLNKPESTKDILAEFVSKYFDDADKTGRAFEAIFPSLTWLVAAQLQGQAQQDIFDRSMRN